MKKLGYIAGACLTATFLAACGGATQSVSPSTPTRYNVERSEVQAGASSVHPLSSLKGETFAASDVEVKGACPQAVAQFSTSGAAAGPYPGTFKATGSWYDTFSNKLGFRWHFKESFTITSGHSTISGTISKHRGGEGVGPMDCHHFGPAPKKRGLTFVSRSLGSRGLATVGDIKKGYLKETLH